jgi:hypothetical protein
MREIKFRGKVKASIVYCRIDHSPFVPEVIGNIYEHSHLLGGGRQ